MAQSVVGTAGFEPATPRPPVWCASQAALRPDLVGRSRLRVRVRCARGLCFVGVRRLRSGRRVRDNGFARAARLLTATVKPSRLRSRSPPPFADSMSRIDWRPFFTSASRSRASWGEQHVHGAARRLALTRRRGDFVFELPSSRTQRQPLNEQQALNPQDPFQVGPTVDPRCPPAVLVAPRLGNSVSHDLRTYGCTWAISHTSAALNSARSGIWMASVATLRPSITWGPPPLTLSAPNGKPNRRPNKPEGVAKAVREKSRV